MQAAVKKLTLAVSIDKLMGYGYPMILVGISRREDRWGIRGTDQTLLRIYDSAITGGLTTGEAGLKYREIPARTSPPALLLGPSRIYDFKAARSSSKS
jgi:hypothetical protein